MKKESITINKTTEEFDKENQKLDNLKNLIENEMIKIDERYEKVNNETTKSYEVKIEKLKKEEDDLKEKLKTEVTKIKEKLENYLSLTNNLSKECEKIKKGIKSLQNEEKNIIKTLSYVSKITKNQKEMNILYSELMKNIKISFIEDESIIKYEEYYFNGIPIPNEIEFKDIEDSRLKIIWNADYKNLLNLDKNQIKYILEIKKENIQENFKVVYEGSNNNYLITNLEKNTNYEIRICTNYKGTKSNWSEIKRFKTKKINSLILNELEKADVYLDLLKNWTGYKNMELLYRGTRDGSESKSFHNKCDNQGPTIFLCKNEKGNVFGGYASISWTSDKKFHNANGSFLFTLTNIHGIAPSKYANINPNKNNFAVYHGSDRGPAFGNYHDLKIDDNYLNNSNSYSYIGDTYQDILGKGGSIFSGDINNNCFKVKELEVFKVYN